MPEQVPDQTDQPEPVSGGKRRPTSYDVFELQMDMPMSWALITEGVVASSRRDAIRQAVQARPEQDRYGTFATVRSGEFQHQVRKTRAVVVDDWGA